MQRDKFMQSSCSTLAIERALEGAHSAAHLATATVARLHAAPAQGPLLCRLSPRGSLEVSTSSGLRPPPPPPPPLLCSSRLHPIGPGHQEGLCSSRLRQVTAAQQQQVGWGMGLGGPEGRAAGKQSIILCASRPDRQSSSPFSCKGRKSRCQLSEASQPT